MRITFGTQSYRSESLPLSSQRALNCYLEIAPPAAKTPVAVPRSAGILSFGTVSDAGDFRGAHKMARVLYVVHGTTLYRVNQAGVATSLGTIPGVGRVSMSNNGTQLSISNGSAMYVWNGSTLAQVTDPDFPGSTWLAYLDGYTIYGEPNSGRFGITEINDSTLIDGLDFATAESAPDDLVAGLVDHRELFLFGEESYEVWVNTGDADFPFERTSSGIGDIGCAGQFAVTKKANSPYFLGNDAIAYRLDGYNPVRISTHAIEDEFKKRTLSECVVEAWTERGHAFVAYKFSDGTFVYDIATQFWHERSSEARARWRPDFVIDCYDNLIIGSEGKLGQLDVHTYREFDDHHIATCTAPAVADGNAWIEHNRLELIFEMGVGLSTGQGSAPLVMLRWSDDGGRTFPYEKTASLGAMGNHKARAIFSRLGRSRDRVYEWSVSDPVKLWFLEARLNEFT